MQPTSAPNIDLSELKDIHSTLQPDFWPLAPGWYLLLGGVLILGILILVIWQRYKRLPLPYALKELEKIKLIAPKNQMKILAQLLKRVAFVKYPRTEIAPLSEENWQDFLLSSAPNTLTPKQAHSLAFAIYNKEVPDKSLYKNCQKWIKHTLKKH